MADKLPFLPDEHHYAIAAVATRAAQLDAHIEMAIAGLLSQTPEAAKCILKNMNGDKYVQLLEALLLDHLPDQQEQIVQAFATIRSARTERNEIMHWLWGKADQPDQARHVSMRPFREDRTKTKTAAEIQLIADQFLEAVRVITDWQQLQWERRQQSLQQKFEPLALLGHWASASGADHSETPEQPDPQPPPSRE